MVTSYNTFDDVVDQRAGSGILLYRLQQVNNQSTALTSFRLTTAVVDCGVGGWDEGVMCPRG